MGLNETTKTSIAFKKLVSKDHRDSSREWYEETDGGGFNVHGSNVWVDTIPATPPGSTTSIVKVYKDGADGAVKLTHDVSIPDNRGWYAFISGNRRRGWIPAKYGQLYTIKLYEDNGSGTGKGSQIFTTDTINWFWDYETGYLAIQDAPGSKLTPFWVEGYVYTGATAVGGGGGLSPLHGSGNPNGVVTGVMGQLYRDDDSSGWYLCALTGSTDWTVI